jgi:hypothetical protein
MAMLKKGLATAALTVGAGLLLFPPAGQAATVFGSRLNHEPANSGECQILGRCTIVSFIHPSDPNGDPYAGGAPSDGVITKFRIYAYTAVPTQVTFRLADINRPNPMDPNTAQATAAGTGPTVTIQPAAQPSIQEFGGRLSVKKGQHLAIDATDVQATYNTSGDKFSYIFTPPLVDGAAARMSLQPTGELLVQGTIEPDADGDGFGDETQDQCPSQASTQGQCDKTLPVVKGLHVSGNTISYRLSEAATVSFKLAKKAPGRKVGGKCVAQTAKNRTHRRCPRFKPIGASFSGPGKTGADHVTLPNGRKLGPGVYRLTMTATDVAGNRATTTTTFKIKKKKKK